MHQFFTRLEFMANILHYSCIHTQIKRWGKALAHLVASCKNINKVSRSETALKFASTTPIYFSAHLQIEWIQILYPWLPNCRSQLHSLTGLVFLITRVRNKSPCSNALQSVNKLNNQWLSTRKSTWFVRISQWHISLCRRLNSQNGKFLECSRFSEGTASPSFPTILGKKFKEMPCSFSFPSTRVIREALI